MIYTLLILPAGMPFTVSAYGDNSEDARPKVGEQSEIKPQIGRMGDPVGVDPETFEFSPAENKIWLDNHLGNIDKPARLYYAFSREGTDIDGFTDAVYLDIIRIYSDGSRDTVLEFFSADRQQIAGADNLNHVTGNPVIGIYMQGDVMEMNRLTKGSWRYFQRRIKLAISDDARIEPVKVKFDGKIVDGEKITILPYLKDPRRNQFMDFADKRYEFIFSKHIPGALYQILTIVPGKSEADSEPMIKETLTLQTVDFRSE